MAHLVGGDLTTKIITYTVGQGLRKIRGGNETIAIAIEDLEDLDGFYISYSAAHAGQENGQIHGHGGVAIYLTDHDLKISLRGALTKRAHDSADLLG